METTDGTRAIPLMAAGEAFPEGAVVGLDFAPPDLYLFHAESRGTICYGID